MDADDNKRSSCFSLRKANEESIKRCKEVVLLLLKQLAGCIRNTVQ